MTYTVLTYITGVRIILPLSVSHLAADFQDLKFLSEKLPLSHNTTKLNLLIWVCGERTGFTESDLLFNSVC